MKSSTPPSTDSETFSGCSSLTTVYVPEGATSAYNDVSPWSDYEIVEFLDALNISVSVTLPSEGTPEHLYTMKSGNNYYANGTTSPTQTAANRACFAFYQSEAEGAYYIYCYTSNKWLGYTKSSDYNNGRGFIVLSDTKTEGAYFKCNNYSGDNYDIAPYNTTGVASKYLNWYQGVNNSANPLDGTVTLGLWEQDGATDAGSSWVFSEVFLPISLSTTLPSEGKPEHLYTMKNGSGLYANGATSPTLTEANRALFAFYDSDVAGAYYIYCYSSQKWLGYDNTNSDTNMCNFIQLSKSKADAAYFKFTFNTGNGYYDIVPYNATGVASKYLNWYGDTDYNPLDGTNTLGLWEQDGATDAGSRWIFSEVFRPISLSTTLPSEGKPEHLYTMKNGYGLYANGVTSPTQTEANRALFAFYGSGVAGAYYIYCYSSQKWLGYDNTKSDTNMRNFIKLSESKADAAYFKFTYNAGNGYYDIVPYNATGVASKYLNWNGSTNHNPLDGTNTLGLWEQDGATDAGSRWIFEEVIVSNTWNFSDNGSAIYAQAEDAAKNEINYTRNYAHTGWQALYVPFDIPYDEISDNFDVSELNYVYQFDDDGDGAFDRTELEVLRLKAGDVIAHNTPYVIRAKAAGEHTITVTDATLYKSEAASLDCSSLKYRYVFQGTYSGVGGSDMYSNGYYSFSEGTLCKAASASTALGGFRWYVSVEDLSGTPVSPAALPAKMRIVEKEGGEATGIATAPTTAPLLKDASVYDLNGRRIGTADAMDALPKGVYIVNGKKVMK